MASIKEEKGQVILEAFSQTIEYLSYRINALIIQSQRIILDIELAYTDGKISSAKMIELSNLVIQKYSERISRLEFARNELRGK